ncbi:MAG: PKD domain-containing protein [Myxococcales bacterium]|nr:PKD domain-containing protein [Myxococcales bacterium]
MIRNATCGAGYDVTWDVNRDGVYNDWTRTVAPEGTTLNVWEAGRTYRVPSVPRDSSLNINVRVHPRCAGQPDKFGTYRMFVYDFTPSPDPRNWSTEQLEIMAAMGVQETLWYLHRQMGRFGSRNVSTITGQMPYEAANGLALWLMTINGNLPAYPPNTINWHGQQARAGFEAENTARWNATPYAETAMRLTNAITNTSYLTNIAGGEEANTCGLNPNGTERTCNRLPNTSDNRGLYTPMGYTSHASFYANGIMSGALPTVLPALNGTPVQTGGVQGWIWEQTVQQMVDWMGYAQIDGGCGKGGWLYHEINGNGGCGDSDGSTTQWAYIALESAEVAGGPYGVFVNNRHKYRIADNLINNQTGDGGAAYRSSYNVSNLQLTGGAFVAARWLGVHHMSANDNSRPFRFNNNDATHSGVTAGSLRSAYDRYIAFMSNQWTSVNRSGSIGWNDGLWYRGSYLCGNTNSVYNWDPNTGSADGPRCGNTYAMYSSQKGYRTGTPELTTVGGHDWFREFNIYYLRAMDRAMADNDPLSSYSVFGRIYDTYCTKWSVTCGYGSGFMSAAMGGLVLTPTIFNPKPVAIGAVQPPQVTEGCIGGNNGEVVFDHSESFHPSADGRIIAYQWDVDNRDGLWWETNADPDFEGNDEASFEHRYQRAGVYTATLRVVDNVGQSKTTTVTVTVNQAANVPPSAASGGNYAIEEGQALELRGNGTDGNTGCGDQLTITWDLDNDGAFDDANGATPTVQFAQLAGLPRGQANRIRIRVRDAAGATATADGTLTIYPREPEAHGRANPNPAACRAEVTFDGNGSVHPNPNRTIAQYDWNVDGQAGFEGSGAIFRYTYNRFGTYTVTLRVTDDLGRTDTDTFDMVVDQGNQPPVARIAQNAYVVLEGDNLVLDGRGSSDANTNCGDSIVSYQWDIDGDGQFGGPADATGANPTINWNALQTAMDWPADRNTGLPTNTVTLRVTDTFGRSSTVTAQVTIFRAVPIAEIVQRPNPSPINLQTGFSNTQLDGRESVSPVPGVNIVRHDWDLNDDGTFEVANQPVTNFIKVFQPVPGPDNIPATFVRLRVTDSTGRTGETRYRVIYRVPPTEPTADADPTDPPEQAYDILLGQGVTLDASQSFDPDEAEFGDTLRWYRWDLSYVEGDGFQSDVEVQDADGDKAEAVLQLTAQQLAGFGVDAPGVYHVRLQVEDTTQLTNEDDTTITVHPVNPTAAATVNPNPAACGALVTLDASASDHSHPGVDVVAWRWDLDNDGQYDDANGEVINHAFPTFSFDGPHVVGLEVEDSNGNVGRRQVEVDVTLGNGAPVAVAGGFRNQAGAVTGPYAIALGDDLRLNAAGSADPNTACGDAIVSYQWDVDNDGTFDHNGQTVDLTAAELAGLGLDSVGQYTVRLRVTDRFGVTSDGVATLRIVNGPTARATASPNRANCQQQVTFSAEQSGTDGPAGQGFNIVSYEWDLDGDGQYDDAMGQRFSQAVVALPDENGDILVTAGLRVTDASGRTDTTEVQVTIDVQNNPPVANAGGPYTTGPVGNGYAPVRLDARGSTDPNAPCDTIVEYRWDTDNDGLYGDDDNNVAGSPNGRDYTGAVIDAYRNPNWQVNTTQTVHLIVCDAEGACSQVGETEIRVQAEAPPQGEVLSPRSDDDVCIGAGNFQLDLQVSDPEGDRVTAVVTIGGQQVARRENIPTNANGNPVVVDPPITIDANLVPEGRHRIIVTLTDDNGGSSETDSGGRLTFDRTPPQVTFGNQPGQNVCYNPNGVPDAQFNVTDTLDAAPATNEEILEDGCGRILRVTATDACGNEGQAERAYLLAQAVDLELDGVADGALVAQAAINWDIVGPDACAQSVTANYTVDGGASQGYNEGAMLNQPGNYAMTISVANCQGVARQQILNFTVNRPPVAVPRPDGHPNADPALANAYVVAEGAGLQVNGGASLPPENNDQVVRYEWDFNGDGQFDAEGQLAAFPTDEDGIFNGRLRVTDSIGATHTTDFRVTVTDVDPTADAAGPYVVAQGVPLQLNGGASRPGSAADPIREYVWSWDDGTPDTVGADQATPTHTFADDGVYNVRLTVRDEDSEHSVVVRVEVRDVDPVIDGIVPPDDTYEIRPMAFRVNATAGAPNDPITQIEWDFDNDGVVDARGADAFAVTHQFIDAGDYTVVVRVQDGDSEIVDAINVQVREITTGELITFIGERVDAGIADQAAPVPARIAMAELNQSGAITNGEWGEDYDRRGVTLVALQTILNKLVETHQSGYDFGLELWAAARQVMRDLTRMEQAILDDPGLPDDQHPSMAKARTFLAAITDEFARDGFRDDAESQNRTFVTQELLRDGYEAYFWLVHAIDPCTGDGGFDVPPAPGNDPVQRSFLADALNTELAGILRDIDEQDMQDYVTAGTDEGREGPARAEVLAAQDLLGQIRGLQAKSVRNPCPEGAECVSDEEALDMELQAVQLNKALDAIASKGGYVRNWQACMVETIKFRIELSILRVEFACGRNTAVSQRARQVQSVGLEMVANGDLAEALDYYNDPARSCLIIQTYNECLVPQFPDLNDERAYPADCVDQLGQ